MTQHTPHRCDDGTCGRAWCQRCENVLSLCTVCRGGEADLPSECPGYPMHEDTARRVAAGWIDFKGGKWIALGDPENRRKRLDRPTPGDPGAA